jgi:hypothetical protein
VEHNYDAGGSIMYSDSTLTNYLQESNAIETKSKIIAEWNLNTFENIDVIGNYKNRPIQSNTADTLSNSYIYEDENTLEANRTWYGFTDYDTTIDGGYTDMGGTPVTFSSPDIRQKSLMSLEDCFKRFRPRSGINKLRSSQTTTKYLIPVSGKDTFAKPRYYPAGLNDNFKYWSSYRRKGTEQYGISDTGSPYSIQDAAPFIKYKNKIPTNKIVIKLQTNVSDVDSSSLLASGQTDPFYIGSTTNYKSTPLKWKIQKLDDTNNWITIKDITADQFTSTSGWDGYFQLSYGLTNDEVLVTYKNNFKLLGTLYSTSALPNLQNAYFKGQAYLVKTSDTDIGTLYICKGTTSTTLLSNYAAITPTYGWYISEENITNSQLFVTELSTDTSLPSSAPQYVDSTTQKTVYREFEYINGLRIVVNSMSNKSSIFDLIELSPRLCADITELTSEFSLKKYASDLGISGLPVGQLLASNGTMSIFDYNQIFNSNNKKSLLNIYDSSDSFKFSFVNKNLQLKFYEIISRVKQSDLTYKDYFVPLKTMYADGFPQYDDSNRNMSITLRDFTFYLESQIAPEILLTNASTSYIVGTLLDSIGFSNYTFTRLSSESDAVISYFMIAPNKTIMQVLQDLAIATQTTMFFDELNNFVVMGKNYLVPSNSTDRNVNLTLYGSDSNPKKANIINISSESQDIYNDGKIVYYNKYIQKQTNKTATYGLTDKYQDVEYKKIVFWSIADIVTKKAQSKNEEDPNASSYTLSAVPLSTDLSDSSPRVDDTRTIVDNIINFDDGVWWLQRFQGYFYANGEIIKYDSVEYQVGDNKVWIETADEYSKYYSQLTNGQKMYRTGKVRIYAEPKYESYNPSTNSVDTDTKKNTATRIKIGDVARHGRAQFGTTKTKHNAGTSGLDSEWTTSKTPLVTDWQYLFKKTPSSTVTQNITDLATTLNNKVMSTPKTTIKNFLSIPKYNVKTKSLTYAESVQASALCLNGPTFEQTSNNGPTINYVKKDFSTAYDTYGTRVRILGSAGKSKSFQVPTSSYLAYSTTGVNTSLAPSVINAASGGIGIRTNGYGEGYYYEIAALDYLNTDAVVSTDGATINNLIFYKMEMIKDGFTTTTLSGTFKSDNTVLEANANGTFTLTGNSMTLAVGKLLEIRNSTQAGLYTITSMGSSLSKWKLTKVIPVLKPTILYSNFMNIFVDTGKFTSKVLSVLDGDDSVYDIAIKLNVSSTNWIFSVYINNILLSTVYDNSPIIRNTSNNVLLFTRGSSQMMFENVYAIQTLKEKPTTPSVSTNIFDSSVSNISYSKYALGPIVKQGFLSKLSPSDVPSSNIFYEEFGTIMRECSYLNVKFDKAYPALNSVISPLSASLGGYMVTGYSSTPYRAEFLIFNTTDFALSLGDGKSYATTLNITGVGFTTETAKELTVDSFYNNRSTFSTNSDYTANDYKNKYANIKNNRLTYGPKSFTIDSPYIQNEDTATKLMDYIIKKISKPRKAVAVEIFGMPIIQLGDLVNFSYDTQKTLPNAVTGNNYVVYAIEHQTKQNGPSTILYLSEVLYD